MKVKRGKMVFPLKGKFKGLQCLVESVSPAKLAKIVHGKSATYEWTIDLEVINQEK